MFQPRPVAPLEERTLLSTLLETTPPTSPSPSAPWTETQNIPFPTADGRTELLDVYIPDTPAPPGGYPVMIAIHGGGWRARDKDEFGLRTAQGFTPDGYVVVAPNYILSAPGKPTWPMNFEDIQNAVRWVRGHAAALNFNNQEIVAEGESAGANLAALLGVYSPEDQAGPDPSSVDAVVAVSTPADLVSLYHEKRYAGTAAAEFLGGSPAQVRANYIAASPIDHVAAGDPPMLLVHGRQDPVVPVSQSQQFSAALSNAGVPNQLELIHGTHALEFPTREPELIPGIVAFLNGVWQSQSAHSGSTS